MSIHVPFKENRSEHGTQQTINPTHTTQPHHRTPPQTVGHTFFTTGVASGKSIENRLRVFGEPPHTHTVLDNELFNKLI